MKTQTSPAFRPDRLEWMPDGRLLERIKILETDILDSIAAGHRPESWDVADYRAGRAEMERRGLSA